MLVVALGMTLVILTGEIDISVGSRLRDLRRRSPGCSAKAGLPMPLVVLAVACAVGAALGAVNGALVAYLRHPVDRRHARDDGGAARRLRWATQGAWVQDLPAGFSGSA